MTADGALRAVTALVAGLGVGARPLREAIALLTEGPHTLDALVRESTVARRGIEELLAALAGDLDPSSGRLAIRPELVPAYRRAFGYDQLRRTRAADPLAGRLAGAPDLLAELAELVAGGPAAAQSLDHVVATPETLARRALWLDATFDLAGAHLLCVGDHDLTSLAVAAVNADVAVTVVDVDERVLAYLDERSGGRIRCLYGDLRFGLPGEAAGWADLVFTDPPYTPEGVRLFLSRGLQGLRDREHGRLVLAYGFGERQPVLGLKVQQAIGTLQLAYTAILPGFNRYRGAQAVGSASDLYVCQPTARSWKVLDEAASAANIYTHGAQALEGAAAGLSRPVADAVLEAAAGPAGLPVAALVGDGWPGLPPGSVRVGAATLFGRGLPANLGRRDFAVAVDLSADPGPWLVRALLAANAARVALLVPNAHPDLASGAAQRALTDLVGSKYRLRLRRSVPESRYAIVEADPATDGDPVARLVLRRAHGTVANSWREGLVQAGAGITKNQARAAIAAAARRPELLDTAPVSLPRAQLAAVLDDIARTV